MNPIIRLNPSGATHETLNRRMLYGGRKGRAAIRRLRRQTRIMYRLARDIAIDLNVTLQVTP